MNNQVNDLLMLTDQEIDFGGLSVEMLEQLALESDPYIANAALTELWARNRVMAAEASQELLARVTNEHFLQATALRVVFEQISGREEEMGDYLEPDAFADFVQVMQ